MKRFITALSLTLALTGVVHAESYDEHMRDLHTQTCNNIEGLARSVVVARQLRGIPMKTAMDTATMSIARDMIKDAYSENRWMTAENRADSVDRFTDKWYAQCVKQYGL